MRSIGTAYYNGALYKHRLPPFIEWHRQIWGPGVNPQVRFANLLPIQRDTR